MATKSFEVAQNWYLQLAIQCDKLLNVTVTRTAGKLNVKGTLGTVSTSSGMPYSGAWIRLTHYNDTIYENGKYYTIYCKIKDNVKNTSVVNAAVGGTRTTILEQHGYNGNEESVHIIQWGSGTTTLLSTIWLSGYSSGESFDIDFYSVQLYEGQFVNPPRSESLDSKPNIFYPVKQFNNRASFSLIKTVTLNTQTWNRLVMMNRYPIDTTPCYGNYFRGIIGKGISAGGASYYKVECMISYGPNFPGSSKRYMLKAEKIPQANTTVGVFTKFRLAYSPSGYIFLEAYYVPGSMSNQAWVFKDMELTNGLYDQEALEFTSNDGKNDTLIGSEVTPTDLTTTYS